MALFLDEQQVTDLLTMEMAIAAVEDALTQQGLGTAINNPRTRVRLPTGQLHMMGAALPSRGVIGYKAYTAFKGKVRFHVMLYSTDTGELLAMLQADRLGQMRTGAASGVATKYMARDDAHSVGIFGTGWQARSQLEAVCAVRQIQVHQGVRAGCDTTPDVLHRNEPAARHLPSNQRTPRKRRSKAWMWSLPPPTPANRSSMATGWNRAPMSMPSAQMR